MGRNAGDKRSARSSPGPSPATAAPHSALTRSGRATLKHPWLVRITAAVLVPALLLALIEIALRVGGYGYSTKFFEDTGDGKTLTTNQKFAWQFYSRAKATSPTPLLFAKQKSPGARRVFILGESAAAGTPDPAFGFGRQLELMLRAQYPGDRIEVLNAAMRGIDSHIIRQIAAECAELSPDLFIVYAGNNEMIGLHSPSPEEFQLTANVHWLRLQHAVKRTKLAQLGESLLARLSRNRGAKEQDMAFFRRQRLAFDDSKRDAVYRNYEINLRDICRLAEFAGAQVILCSVAVNLHDFPPLGSLHRRGLGADQLKEWERLYSDGIAAEARREYGSAVSIYEAAAALDGSFAELSFRTARCYEALRKTEEARRYYAHARDWDAIQFRTDSRLNNIARSVATNSGPHARLLDVENICERSPLAENGIPGGNFFHEHVHFKFDGDHLLASTLLPEAAAALKLPPPSQPPLTRDECARRLAYTPIDEANLKAAVAHLTASAPFLDQLDHSVRQAAADTEAREKLGRLLSTDVERVIVTYTQALRARPDDWMLHYNFGNLLNQAGRPRAAAAEFAEVVKRLPGQRNFRVAYGNALLQSGQRAEAVEQFAAALKIDPAYPPAQQGLKAARAGAPNPKFGAVEMPRPSRQAGFQCSATRATAPADLCSPRFRQPGR